MASEIEKEIHRIQKSTKTLFRFFNPLHNKLRMKFGWYYRWHLRPYHRHAHYSTLAVFSVTAVMAVVMSMFSFSHKTYATGSAVSVSDASTATIINTGNKIYFDSVTYKTNVTIDNYTRQMAGYAWSEDFGWVDFGGGADNPSGPVIADAAGHLSGKAKVLYTGGYLDFNNSPSGANVIVSGGNFSGFAWNDMYGWVDFGGVSAPLYVPDLQASDNPTVTAKSSSSGVTLTTNTLYNYPTPYFSWPIPADNTTPPTTPSGVAGYFVYFGADNAAVPTSYQTAVDFTAPNLGASYGTYYLRIKTIDVAGNVSTPATLFTYQYNASPPTAPAYVSVAPSGYSRTNTFTFSWPVTGSGMATDTSGSGLNKFQYRINNEASWHDVTGNTTTANIVLSGVATTGVNTFDLQSVDNIGNYSPPVRTNFYFNDSAPAAPASLAVVPSGASATNAFSFSWTASPGEIAGYYYSVNIPPTLSNANFTSSTSLASGPYATQQGSNILYVVAKDNAGNYDFSGCSPNSVNYNPNTDTCAAVAFTTNTVAPGIPGAPQAYDISDRDTQDYSVAVKWTVPSDTGSGFAGYDIYRSADGIQYSKVGSTTSTIYADGGLSSQIYFYYVISKDNAGNFSAMTTPVTIVPTGKFTSAPVLVSGPTVVVAPTSITVSWATDRVCSSFVQIKDGNTFVSEQGQTEQTTNHTVKVVGLRSQRDYIYNIKSTDVDGNTLTGDDQKFTTANTPSVYDLTISNITQTSAIINFKSTAIANFTLYYGETADYGNIVTEDSSSTTTNHSLALSSLKPGMMYYFRIRGDDTDGNELRSENSFMTLPMPSISKFAIQPDTQAPSTTLMISWTTNVPTTSTVKYSTDGTKFSEKSASDMVTDHEITISDLQDKSKYTIYALGTDKFGNVAESDKVTFDTPTDTRPTKISDIVIESSNVGNQSTTAQVAVSWKTDEPANSQIEYSTGISGSDYTNKTIVDGTYSNNHLVIITGLDPSKPYHLRVVVADMAGNVTRSGDNTVITGEVSHSALQIILATLTNIFGWMSKLIH